MHPASTEPSSPERIGIFGGSFDPPHIGHLVAALEVHEVLGLDRMLLIPANIAWQKAGTRAMTPAGIRLEMVRAAVQGLPQLEVSDREIRRGGDSFTIDTVEELLAENPDREIFVVVGADVEELLPTWKRIDALRALARFVVVTRGSGGRQVGNVAGDDHTVLRVSIPPIDPSSTALRDRVAHGRTIAVLVPDAVRTVINRHGLYRVGE